ncbi:acyl carrier protein [Nocardiopsis halotolerans]|uniref:acyl carrier protein n=1 Tax=Nocardiopsis halotolerans TaxID=124252 RepID=UPI00037CF268|nr:acyl carrier protein [Nocardiopsis halotolerans]
MLITSTIAEEVVTHIRSLLGDAIEDDPITASDPLNDLGLNSIMMARLIVALERDLNLDPFSDGSHAIVDIHSVGDLVEAYQDAASAPENSANKEG